MPSATISNVGFTTQFAPVVKRATATLSDGSVVTIIPDPCLSTITGADDTTGSPKLHIYKSDTTRSNWILSLPVSDLFARTTASGWGTSPSGQAWTTSGGSASDYSTDTVSGKQSNGTVNVQRTAILDSGFTDQEILVDVQQPLGSPTGAGTTSWICGRAADTSNYYVARLDLATSGTMSLGLHKNVAGTVTQLVAPTSVGSNSANNVWRVKFQVIGTTVRAKAWNVTTGGTEPASWTVSTTDSSLTTGTKVALLSRLETGNTNTLPVVWLFDNLSVQTVFSKLGSATQAPVCSMVLDSSDNMHVVYQGTDNSLQYAYFTYSSGGYKLNIQQVVVAANAVTNRYRAVDIDVPNSGSTANVAIIAYESKASAGPSAWTRVYVRNNDGTTWRNAYTDDHASYSGGSLPIYQYSEDVSISYNTAGVVANIAQLLIFYTRTASTNDRGDVVREVSYNVSTGTDGSATVLGTWPTFNQSVAAGSRRGWIFKTTSNIWQVAMSVGATSPTFMVMRLTHGSYGAPVIDQTRVGAVYTIITVARIVPFLPQISPTANAYNAVGCTYNDNRVMFGFISNNTISIQALVNGFSASAIVFRYNDPAVYTVSYVDNQMRPLDNFFTYGNQPVGVYGGGNNRNQAGDLKFNFMVLYGFTGNNTANLDKMRAVVDTFYDPPTIVGPTATQPNDTPILQVRVQNTALYPNIKGKIEWQLAQDANFSVDMRDILEPDANYRYFGSLNNQIPPPISVSLKLSGIGPQKLYSGTWWMRARVVSDLGQVSAWSGSQIFSVSHPPGALPKSPSPGSMNDFGLGSIKFTWGYSDTEPTDTQTAYQLQILRLDTGSVVLDTGKVTSNLNSTIQTLSATLKDVPLQWSVSLWDTDNVQGPFSTPIVFTVGDAPTATLTSPTSGGTVTSAAPTVTWAFADGASRVQQAFRISAWLADLLDTFTRTVSSNWGTSDNSVAWTVQTGTAAQFSTGGSTAACALNAVNSPFVITAGVNKSDGDFIAEVTVPAVAVGAAANVYVITRWIDANNHYRVRFAFNTDSTVSVGLEKVVASTFSTPVAQVVVANFTYTAGATYVLKVSMLGTLISAKIWAKSATEPSSLHLNTIDTSLKNTGAVGFRFLLGAGNTNTLNYTFTVDNVFFASGYVTSIADSGWVQSPSTTYTFLTNVLANNSYYMVKLQVQDNVGMQGSTIVGVLTSWIHPSLGDITVITDNYGATVSWTNANIDLNFVSWRVYRRYMVPALSDLDDSHTATTWVLIYENTNSQASYSFKDYLIPCNKSADYVVVQVADRFGSLIESNITSFTTVTLSANRYYFIPDVPIGTIASYEAVNVTDDSYTDEVESATLHVIGRGRQVQVGDDLGVSGTLTIQLRSTSSRADREFIQRLASTKNLNTWMKNPFGDVRLVKFLSVSVKFLAGTGVTEMSDLSVPYVEVFSDPQVTR